MGDLLVEEYKEHDDTGNVGEEEKLVGLLPDWEDGKTED